MYCIKCGKKNQPDFTYCYNCGAQLVKDGKPIEPSRPPMPPANPNRPPDPATLRQNYIYGHAPFGRRGEPQRYRVAPNGKPSIVVDFPEAFYEYKNQDGKRVYAPYATMQGRLLAVMIDTTIYFIIQALTVALLTLINPGLMRQEIINDTQFNEIPEWATLLIFTLYFLYCTLTTWRFGGRTLGKRVTRIKVVRLDGKPPDFNTAFRRNIFGYSLGLGIVFVGYGTFGSTLGLTLVLLVIFGFAAAFFSLQRRGWHDRLAETLVVGQQELIEGVNY